MEAKIDYIVNWAKKSNKSNEEIWDIAWNYCLDNKLLVYWPIIAERIMNLN